MEILKALARCEELGGSVPIHRMRLWVCGSESTFSVTKNICVREVSHTQSSQNYQN